MLNGAALHRLSGRMCTRAALPVPAGHGCAWSTPQSADKLQRTLLVRMSSSASVMSEVNAASLMSWEGDMSVGAHAHRGHLATMWCALSLPTHWVIDMSSLFAAASFALCAPAARVGLWA